MGVLYVQNIIPKIMMIDIVVSIAMFWHLMHLLFLTKVLLVSDTFFSQTHHRQNCRVLFMIKRMLYRERL